MGILERRGGGGGTSTTTITSSVSDATTVIKGKLKLAGHFAGTADTPILSTTAEPQTARFGLGVAPPTEGHLLTVKAPTNSVTGTYWANWNSYFDFTSANTVSRLHSDVLSSVNQRSYYSRVTAKQGGGLGNNYRIGFESGITDYKSGGTSQVAEYYITSINSSGLVTVSGPSTAAHPYQAGDRVLITGTSLAAHNAAWIVAASPAPTATTFTLTGAPASSSTGGRCNNAPAMLGFVASCDFRVDRSVLTGSATNFDDTCSYTAKNNGIGRGTDCFYIGTSNNVHGDALSVGSQTLPVSTFDVDSTVGFNSQGGSFVVGGQTVTYTAMTATSFTGCTGGTGVISTGTAVTQERTGWITGYNCSSNCDFGFIVGSVTVGADNAMGFVPGWNGGAAFDCSRAILAPGAYAMRVMNNGPIVARGVGSLTSTMKEIVRVGTSNQVLLANNSDPYDDGICRVGVWANDANPQSSNVGGRVFQLYGTAAEIPEVRIQGTDASSKAQLSLYAFAADGTTEHRLLIENSGAGLSSLRTTSAQALGIYTTNTERLRFNSGGNLNFAAGQKIGWSIGSTPPATLSFAASTTETDGIQFGADASAIRFYRYGANLTKLKNSDLIISNAKGLKTLNAAGSSTINLISTNASDQINIGDFGQDVQTSFFRNNSIVFYLNSSSEVKLNTGVRLSGGDGIVVKTKAGVIADGDYTTPTSGMLGIDTTNHTLAFRAGSTWYTVSGGTSYTFSDTGTPSGNAIDFTLTGSDVTAVLPTTAKPQITTLGLGVAADATVPLLFAASTSATGGMQFGADGSPIQFYRDAANSTRLLNADLILSNAKAFKGRNAADSTTHNLIQINSSDQVLIGSTTVTDIRPQAQLTMSAKNIAMDTTTGMKIGTGTTQKLGLWNATPVVQPSAYTQTYSTATRTVSTPTSAQLTTVNATQTVPWGFASQAQAENIATQFNLLRSEVYMAIQLINSLVDDHQSIGACA